MKMLPPFTRFWFFLGGGGVGCVTLEGGDYLALLGSITEMSLFKCSDRKRGDDHCVDRFVFDLHH